MKNGQGLSKNIGTKERVVSIIAGSSLLLDMLADRDRSFLKTLTGGYLLYRGVSGHCVINQALGITDASSKDIHINTSIIVDKPRSEVYDFWRNLENLPKIMKHIEKVEAIDEETSNWEANMPGGVGKISWKSKITEDVPNEHISWRSLPDSTIENVGDVRFKDVGKETKIKVDISYRAPLGTLGKRVAKVLNPALEGMVKDDIRNFRKVIETREAAVVTDGERS
ncbi:MAG: SRPBCC family protein [Balneolaceae bacterium]